MTDTRDVGDGYPIGYEARDVDTGALVDATVALTITAPDGTTTTPPVTHAGTGIYQYTIPGTAAGVWFWRWDVSGTVADRAYGSVLFQDPAPVSYASLQDVKDFLKIKDTRDDAEISRVLPAATLRVNKDTGRPRGFWPAAAVSTRTYRATHPTLLMVDDIATVDGLLVDMGRGTSWTAVDLDGLDYLPENAAADTRAIEVLRRTDGSWPVWGNHRVRVTARFGWLTVPADIVTATCIQAGRLFNRKDSVNGVVGNSDYGPVRITRYDADYDLLIGPYVKTVL
jgi:hypothetical protein